jgi:hypothetical protein
VDHDKDITRYVILSALTVAGLSAWTVVQRARITKLSNQLRRTDKAANTWKRTFETAVNQMTTEQLTSLSRELKIDFAFDSIVSRLED